jgi:hypothetical protein
MRLVTLGVMSALVVAELVLAFGTIPYALASAVGGGMWLWERSRHPPRPDRMKGWAAYVVGAGVGRLAVWGWALATTPTVATPKPTEDVDPIAERAEILVNDGRYAEASALITNCTTDVCVAIRMRIDIESQRRAPGKPR